jgi:hemoglobin-like flavoprotein
MTPAQIRTIRASFTRVEQDLPTLARRFYLALPVALPDLRAPVGGDTAAHEETFVKALDELMHQRSAIALPALGGGTAAMPAMAELGRRHVAIGVRSEHFPVMRLLLMALLREAMGAGFTEGAQAAWDAAFDALAKAMLDGIANLPNTEDSFFHRLAAEEAGSEGASSLPADSTALNQFFR